MAALLLSALLLATGCAKRVWTPAEKPIGKAREVVLDERDLRTEAALVEGDGAVAVEVALEQVPQARIEQRWKVYERGEFDARDAHRKGNYWIGGGLVAAIVPCFLAVPDEETGERMVSVGTAALASAGVAGTFALVGATQHLAPSLPAATRNVERTTRSTVVDLVPEPGAGQAVVVRGEGPPLAEGRTDGLGRVRLDLGLPDEYLLLVEVDGVQRGPRLDLRTTLAWRLASRARVASLVAGGHYAQARQVVAEAAGHDDEAWGRFCEEVVAGWGELDVAERADALGSAPVEAQPCGDAWSSLDAQLAAELLPVALSGDAEAWRPALARGNVLAAARRTEVDALDACWQARSDEEVESSWARLQALQGKLTGAGLQCVDASLARIQPAHDRAVAARERAERAAILAEERAAAAAEAAFRRQPATWAGRIKRALAACDRFHDEVGRRKLRVYRLADAYDPRAESEARALQEWIEGQEEGAMGDALQTLRDVMDEMEAHDREGLDTSLRREQLAWDAERHCSGNY